eukprot:2106919-Prymnesium_polylepis.1
MARPTPKMAGLLGLAPGGRPRVRAPAEQPVVGGRGRLHRAHLAVALPRPREGNAPAEHPLPMRRRRRPPLQPTDPHRPCQV